MAIKIAQVQNLQQLDVLVAGPDDANHLFIIDGQFDATLTIAGPALISHQERKPSVYCSGQNSLTDSSFEQLRQLQ